MALSRSSKHNASRAKPMKQAGQNTRGYTIHKVGTPERGGEESKTQVKAFEFNI